MPATLVIAEAGDRLARYVGGMVSGAIRYSSRELFSTGGLALTLNGTQAAGTLVLAGEPVALEQLNGVLFLPTQRWRPPASLGARQRAFVRHELQAAWCAIVAAMPCPVLNRLPPDWWINDRLYAADLARSFARQLALPHRMSMSGGMAASADAKVCSLYFVGSDLLTTSPTLAALKDHVSASAPQLARWQRATGIGLARVDLLPEHGFAVAHLDPVPSLAHAPRALLKHMGRLVAGALA